MKKIIFILSLLSFAFIKVNAQFEIRLSTADSLRQNGDMIGALQEFKKIYAKNPTDQNNIYNYACALSITRQADSAFKYLNIAVNMDTSTAALTDPDFLYIMENHKWDAFENRLIPMIEKKFKNPYKDIEYAKKLWKMQALDQAYMSDLDIVEKKIGKNSSVTIALWDLKDNINKQNQIELETLIATKGWPKKSEVGGTASGAAFLIIQHSDNEKQKKYLPVIKKLCEEKEAAWQSYALMYDRIQISDNKPQKYGSQVKYNDQTKKYELYPLEDEEKIDEWRKEVGLGPLSEYASHWGIVFTPKK